jgi:hypothetical protein
MAYTYQSFTSGQIFTGAQAQQIEDNIRDHKHGVDGVVAAGAAWVTTSTNVAFSTASTDAGKLFKCFGDFSVTFAAAATLGANFGAAYVNCGSGRVQLTAASGQFIHQHSYYALAPGEGVIVSSDGIELEVVGGSDKVRLQRVTLAGSAANITLDRLYPNDFRFYEIVATFHQTTTGEVTYRFSQDSGSSFLATGYSDATANTTLLTLRNGGTSSAQMIWANIKFTNNYLTDSMGVSMMSDLLYHSGGGFAELHNYGGQVTAKAQINAIQFSVSAGGFLPPTNIELYGYGRLRK